jgi:hypothetical protein
MVAVSLHYLGDQANARRHIERMHQRYTALARPRQTFRLLINQEVAARIFHSRILWLQGLPDQAARMAESAVEESRTSDHAASLCYALAEAACPIALYSGELGALDSFVATLRDVSARHGFGVWNAVGGCFGGALGLRRGDAKAALRRLHAAVDELRRERLTLRHPEFLGTLAEGQGQVGRVAEGLLTISEALERVERTEQRWCISEFLRIKGELVLLEGAAKAGDVAEDHFRQSIGWAARQGALSWELRGTVSLARLWHAEGRTKQAHDLLDALYERFTEGFGTLDLVTAKTLLEAWR